MHHLQVVMGARGDGCHHERKVPTIRVAWPPFRRNLHIPTRHHRIRPCEGAPVSPPFNLKLEVLVGARARL